MMEWARDGSVSAEQRATFRFMIVVPFVLAILSMIGPFSIDTPFPAFPEMREEFGASTRDLQLVVSVYLGSFALMSVFHGPLSDAVGRRPVMAVSLSVYVLGSIAAAFAPSLAWLLVCRSVQGISAGGATIISRTVIRDMFEGPMAQKLMSRVSIMFGVGPALGAILGGWLLRLGDWPVIFIFQALFGVVLILLVVFVLPESHPRERRVSMHPVAVLGALVQVGRRPSFLRLALSAGTIFGAQFLYIGGAAIFVVDVLGEGERDFWKMFVPMIGSMMVGSWICGRTAGRITARRLISIGCTTAFLGSVVAVVVASSSAAKDLPWAVLGLALIALGNGMCYPTFQLLMLDEVPERRGSVMSLSQCAVLVLNSTVATAITPVVGHSALGFAVTSLVLVGAGLLCWSWHCALEDRDVAVSAGLAEPTDLL